jgi:acyl-CoA hydrolase
VFIRNQFGPFGDAHDAAEEFAHHALLEQAIAVGRKARVVPHRLVHRQADEPAEQHVEIEMLDQGPLGANGEQALQQQGAKKALGRNRRASAFGIKGIEGRRHRMQNHIGQALILRSG